METGRERERLREGRPNEREEMDGEAARWMRVLIWVAGTHCLRSFKRMERSHTDK